MIYNKGGLGMKKEDEEKLGKAAVEAIEKILFSLKRGRQRDIDMFLYNYEEFKNSLMGDTVNG